MTRPSDVSASAGDRKVTLLLVVPVVLVVRRVVGYGGTGGKGGDAGTAGNGAAGSRVLGYARLVRTAPLVVLVVPW